MSVLDPLALACRLIQCRSVTPKDAGAQAVLTEVLTRLGFEVTRLRFGETENLFARRGERGPHLCFAGHTDVVPPGAGEWRHPPFAAEVAGDTLFGRGACDMKGAIAAFVVAIARFLETDSAQGSLSLLITGDEEGPAIDGTARVVEWLRERNIVPDFCVVGEPTNATSLGDTIKIGRRGSLNAVITIKGVQGHAAYPDCADNPIHRLIALASKLIREPLDQGSVWFDPSTLQFTSIDVGNPVSNVTPAAAVASLNIRFNDLHSGEDLKTWLRTATASAAERFHLEVTVSGEPFLTPTHRGLGCLEEAIAMVTGRRPQRQTGGGTSDARFISRLCPVVEFGLVGATMHQVDEAVPVEDLIRLTAIYQALLSNFMAASPIDLGETAPGV